MREMTLCFFCILMCQVKTYMVKSVNFHLMVNCPCNYIARSKGKTFIILLHELLTIRQSQHTAISTHCLSNQKRRMGFRWIIKDCGMELYELHILYSSLGSIDHCDAIASSNHRIGCHCIDRSHTSCSHKCNLTQERINLFGIGIEDISTVTLYIRRPACNLYAQMVLRDNLNSIMILKHCYITICPHCFHQSTLYLKARIISVMKYAKVTVPSFTVKIVCPVTVLVEVNTPPDELSYSFRCITYNMLYRLRVGNIITSNHRVVDVLFKIVYSKVGYSSYSSLCFSRIRFTQRSLAYKGNLSLATISHTQGITHSRNTSTDNQEIEFVYHKCLLLILSNYSMQN